MKHKHEYKQTGEVDAPTNEIAWVVSSNYSPGSRMIPKTVRCLVFICDCGDMLLKPIKTIEDGGVSGTQG